MRWPPDIDCVLKQVAIPALAASSAPLTDTGLTDRSHFAYGTSWPRWRRHAPAVSDL
jgi:hypothetical protein